MQSCLFIYFWQALLLCLYWHHKNMKLSVCFPFLDMVFQKQSCMDYSEAHSMEVLILAVVAGSLQGTKYVKKAGYLSLVLSGILVSSALLAFTLTFPYYTGAEITAPMYQLTAMIDYGRFLQRLEPIFLFIWFVSSFISVTTIFYTSASLYCKIFRIQDMRPIIFPFATILYTIAIVPGDITTVATGYIHRSREYGWTILYIPPLIALIMAIVKKKEVKNKNA